MPPPEEEKDLDLDLDQDGSLENEKEENEGGEPSEEGSEGEGEGGQASQPIKIGDKEYTPEQLTEIVKKGQDYDSLLPDYTRKSQKLAEFEDKGQEGKPKQPEEKPFYEKEGWIPKSYPELQKAIISAREGGKQEALKHLEQMEIGKAEAIKQVDDFIGSVKEKDSEFDDKDFYDFVAKHKLPANSINDLKAAYSVYTEVRTGRTKIPKEDKTRNDSVSGPSGGKGTSYTVPYKSIRKSGSVHEAAMDAYDKIKK